MDLNGKGKAAKCVISATMSELDMIIPLSATDS